MDVDSPKVQAYLYQLNQMAGSDPEVQVSMHEVGDALGIENEQASQLAEVLFIGGHAELKTLSGGIGITQMGMKALGVSPAPGAVTGLPQLSGEPVLTKEDMEQTHALLESIKADMGSQIEDYQVLETTVMDIKTIEVQMLSPAPKTAVVKAVLRSIVHSLPEKVFSDLLERIKALAGE